MSTQRYNRCPIIAVLAIAAFLALEAVAANTPQDKVDFRYAPPQWQTAICLPDDPQKTLVAKSGELFNGGPNCRVEVACDAVWQKQELLSPRVPIVSTTRSAPGLEIVEEAFAVTDEPAAVVRRTDGGSVQRGWARPPLPDIAMHSEGSLRFEAKARKCRIALALCEGWWKEAGKRVQVLRVEGAAPKTVDTIADIGWNKPAVFWFDAKDLDRDGKIEIVVEAAPNAGDKNTILNGLWVFPAGTKPDNDALLAGRLNAQALGQMSMGYNRADLILVHVTNTGKDARALHPILVTNGNRRPMEPVSVAAGKTRTFFAQNGGDPLTLKQALAARERAVKFWERKAGLPFDRIQVPDAGIQALVDSSVRNIWQAREIKNGLPAFQVGPPCYRGLWIVDGAFLLETAALLGTGDQARNGIATELRHQKDDGRIEVLADDQHTQMGYWKESGIVLWTCIRHAQLTQDKAWLESVWPKLQRAAGFIKILRTDEPVPCKNGTAVRPRHTALDAGLVPHGVIDGGIHDGIEYSNNYWSLMGLRSFIEAAHWLGKEDEAAQWQKEYDDFMATFRKAAARDLWKDAHGNTYLPLLMGEAGRRELPQRAQWAFCHAVYPGQLFAKDDPLVSGNLAMLQATEREGMVYGTGWDATGLWTYFASFYAHAWLWQGNGTKAAQILYDYANHAAPLLVWREEQSLKGERYKEVGDMPHNWASAEFIRLVVHLLALDRGDELHLFEGLPAEWMKPGMVTQLNGIATPFGKLTMELKIAGDGKSARLHIEPLTDPSCRKIVVHLNGTLELDPKVKTVRTIPLDPK